MIARYAIGIVLGSVIAFGLLFLMQFLIAHGENALTETDSGHFLDFVRVKEQETLQLKKPKPKKPPKPEEPPPEAPPPQQDAIDPTGEVIAIPAAPVSADVSIGGFGLQATEGDYLPIVKVAPIYPRRAQQRGLEGYVILEFTVTRLGTVTDAKVVESTSSLFDKAAIAAALKFKYKPRVVDGNPIDVAGVLHKITFVLEE